MVTPTLVLSLPFVKIPTFASFFSFKFNGSTRDGPNSVLFTVYSHWALNNLYYIILFFISCCWSSNCYYWKFGTRNISQNILQNDSKYHTEGAYMLYIWTSLPHSIFSTIVQVQRTSSPCFFFCWNEIFLFNTEQKQSFKGYKRGLFI